MTKITRDKIRVLPPNNHSNKYLKNLVDRYYCLATLPELNSTESQEMKEILAIALVNPLVHDRIEDINLFLLDKIEDERSNYDYKKNTSITQELEALHLKYLNNFNLLKVKYNECSKYFNKKFF